MKRKTFTARIIRLTPYNDGEPNRQGCNRDDDPISFAEDLFWSLPAGQYLIEVQDRSQTWTCEARLASTWRAGVPVRPIRAAFHV